jgi:hypothetical protein
MMSSSPKWVVAVSVVAVSAIFFSPDLPKAFEDSRSNPRSVSAKPGKASTRPSVPSSLASTSRDARPALVFVQAPEVAEGDLRARFPQGSRLASLPPTSQPESPVNLTPEFFAVSDPQISFDGTKVLFAASKQRGAHWQIWEMKVDGSSKRQVTNCAADCLRPAYMARENIVYTRVEEKGGRLAAEVRVAKLDGSEDYPITFGPGNFQVETVLKDGRILISADSPLVPKGANSRALYALRPDGSGLQSLRCDHRQEARRGDAAELADGTVVFVKSMGSSAVGELAMIRRGATHNSTLSPLAVKSWSPRPLSEEKLIVARQTANPSSSRARFDLYAVDSSTGRTGGLIYKDGELSSVQAVPVASHAVPRWYWSTLNPEAKSGYFICLDAYHSADEPTGRITTPISKVRALTLDSGTGKEASLGEAPVESDGSFYIAVPPDKPVRFDLLDEEGRVIRSQQSWIWSRPGEERGCVGCHEDKAVAPENRWPLTLRRFDTPTPLGSEVDVKVEH